MEDLNKVGEPQLLVEVWDEYVYDSDNNVMLVESTEYPQKVPKRIELVKAKDNGVGELYIEGIFIQANKPNNNKRIYPKAIMQREVARYIKERVLTHQALGEFNHPKRNEVDPMLAAIIVEDLWWDGDNVMGRARVIEGDKGPGDKLAANIRAGWVPGVSSRGVGSVKRDPYSGFNIVQDNFRLTVAIDVVFKPSAPDAYVNAYRKQELVESEDAVTTSITESSNNANDSPTSLNEQTMKELIAFMSTKLL